MKRMLLATATMVALMSTSFAGGLHQVQYPPGASKAAVSVNEKIRKETDGKEGIVNCASINTATGRCMVVQPQEGGGGDGGSGG